MAKGRSLGSLSSFECAFHLRKNKNAVLRFAPQGKIMREGSSLYFPVKTDGLPKYT